MERPANELRLLHRFELRHKGRVIQLTHGGERLLAFIALEDRPQLRSHVAGSLWPDVPEQCAAANLHSTLSRIRHARSVVSISRDTIQLASGFPVDVQRVTTLARRLQDRPVSVRALPDADALIDDELLPGWYDGWVVPERERFRQIRLHALERLAELLSGAGRYAEAIDAVLMAIASDPFREGPRRTLIGIHLVEGNHAEVIRQFESYRELLRFELDVCPSPTITSLVDGLITP